MLSIITPVRNGEKFIRENIESIQKLSIPYEHIIIDGNSTDNTCGIVNEYSHIKLIQQKGSEGMYQAIHQGFEMATADLITWINCDDVVVKEGYELMYKYISKNSKIDLVYSDSYLDYVHENRKEKVQGLWFGKMLLRHGFLGFVQPSSVYRKQLYIDCGGLNFQKFKIIGDKDLFMRMALKSKRQFKYLSKVSTLFRKHGDSLGDRNQELYNIEKAHFLNKVPLHVKILLLSTKAINKVRSNYG